jgi:hypothetical protein
VDKFFSKKNKEKKKIFTEKKEDYAFWRSELQEMNKSFFMIPTDFEQLFLKEISGGALKLYLFLGFRSKYHTGESWYSIKDISEFFQKDQRTVAGWFSELEKLQLVFRGQDGFKRKATTFLKPYGFMPKLIKKSKTSFEDVRDDIQESKRADYVPEFGLLLNYGFKEYTFVLFNRTDRIYHCSCFLNFKEDDISLLKKELRKIAVKVDNYDIDNSLDNVSNKELTIYNYLLKYFRNESI